MALANRERKVYCLISDGECYEGSIWESANFIRKYDIDNLVLYLNWNGWSAYDSVDINMISLVRKMFPQINVIETRVEDYGLQGLSAHYVRI